MEEFPRRCGHEDRAVKETWEGHGPAKWRCDLARDGSHVGICMCIARGSYKSSGNARCYIWGELEGSSKTTFPSLAVCLWWGDKSLILGLCFLNPGSPYSLLDLCWLCPLPPFVKQRGNSSINFIRNLLLISTCKQCVSLTNFITPSTSNPKCHVTFSITEMNINWHLQFFLNCHLNVICLVVGVILIFKVSIDVGLFSLQVTLHAKI